MEWLLIVAASIFVSAVTAWAVNTVVHDRSEGMSGFTVREQSAIDAARQVVLDADRDFHHHPPGAEKFRGWKTWYETRCEDIEFIFSDIGVKTESMFEIRRDFTGVTVEGTPVWADEILRTDSPFKPNARPLPANYLTEINGSVKNGTAHCRLTLPDR